MSANSTKIKDLDPNIQQQFVVLEKRIKDERGKVKTINDLLKKVTEEQSKTDQLVTALQQKTDMVRNETNTMDTQVEAVHDSMRKDNRYAEDVRKLAHGEALTYDVVGDYFNHFVATLHSKMYTLWTDINNVEAEVLSDNAVLPFHQPEMLFQVVEQQCRKVNEVATHVAHLHHLCDEVREEYVHRYGQNPFGKKEEAVFTKPQQKKKLVWDPSFNQPVQGGTTASGSTFSGFGGGSGGGFGGFGTSSSSSSGFGGFGSGGFGGGGFGATSSSSAGGGFGSFGGMGSSSSSSSGFGGFGGFGQSSSSSSGFGGFGGGFGASSSSSSAGGFGSFGSGGAFSSVPSGGQPVNQLQTRPGRNSRDKKTKKGK